MLSPTSKYLSAIDFPGKDVPAADWSRADGYPRLRAEMRPEDHLRLAWEVLRRTLRYRWHHFRLEKEGLLNEESFPEGRTFLTSQDPARFPGWQSQRVERHWAAPMGSPGEKLSAYVSRLKRANQGWLFVHGHWWVKKSWGISFVADPATPASELDLRKFFAPRQVRITAVSGEETSRVDRDILIPGVVNEVLSPREALIRVRLDVPAATQAEQIALALGALQGTLPFIPDKLARDRALPVRAQLWLRAWDAKKAGVAARAAREKIARSLRTQAERIGDAGFAKDVLGWSLDRFNRIKSDGARLIESNQGEAFLSAMVADGLKSTLLKNSLQPLWTVGWK